jgi:pimeloyl-ACP methyl ester carboxylesterase
VYEVLADCVPDIRAWIDFAVGRGAKRVILQGHSHGAIKAAYYLIATHDPRVCGLVLLSPSDDMGIGRRDLGERLFLAMRERARALLSSGRGRELLPLGKLRYPVSAATFLDCHDQGSMTGMFNMSRTDRQEFPELAGIDLPVLMAVGTVTEAFVGPSQKYIDDVRSCLVNCPSFTGAVIEGAPHNYLEREPELAAVVRLWLKDRWSRNLAVERRRAGR